MSFDLTTPQVAAGFALLGERPTLGPLSVLPPVDKATAKTLLADTDLTIKSGNLSKGASTLFGVLAAPGRKVTSTVVTALTAGVATSTFYAPAEGGPYVAVAETEAGYAVEVIESGAETAVLVATHLGLAGGPAPLEGDAVELTVGGWAALAALADLDEPSSMPGAVRRALGKKPGSVVSAFRTIGPAGAPDPGSGGVREAANWLTGAGLAIQMHDNKLEPTRQGRAVLRALRHYVVAGSVTVDHLTESGPVRAVSLSSIRTTERLFFGVWHVGERGPVIALGEPGVDSLATTLRSLIETPNVLPAAKAVAAVPPAAAPAPGPPPPPSAPTPVWKLEPQWLTYLIGAGLSLALVGAIMGLTGDDDGTGAALPDNAVVTTTVVQTTVAPTTTTTAAPTTTIAVPQTIPPGIIESSTTSSTTTSSTTTTSTTTTTTTTLPPSILNDTFDGSTTAEPLFGPGVMTSEVNGDGQLAMTVFVGGFIPTMYPDPLPDNVEISFDFNPQPNSNGAAFGAILLSEDPGDGALDHYVALFITPVNGLVTMLPWDGGFGAPQNVTIPAEAGFATDQWNSIRFVLVGGQIDVSINDVFVMTWTGVTPVTSGHWGPLIVGAASGDAMLVDNVLVAAVG